QTRAALTQLQFLPLFLGGLARLRLPCYLKIFLRWHGQIPNNSLCEKPLFLLCFSACSQYDIRPSWCLLSLPRSPFSYTEQPVRRAASTSSSASTYREAHISYTTPTRRSLLQLRRSASRLLHFKMLSSAA